LPDVEKRDPLSHLPGYALRRAANAMMSELNLRLAPTGLRVSDASVLLLVAGRDTMTSSDIGKALDIQRANMVPLLRRLTAAGLVARQPIDRKSSAIVLTPAGEVQLERIRGIIDEFETYLLGLIPARHRDHLLPALNALWQSGASGE